MVADPRGGFVKLMVSDENTNDFKNIHRRDAESAEVFKNLRVLCVSAVNI